METAANQFDGWEDAVEQFLEGHCKAEALSALLLRIDLPEEGRLAIRDAMDLVNGLDQSLQPLPVPAGALDRMIDAVQATAARPATAPFPDDRDDESADV